MLPGVVEEAQVALAHATQVLLRLRVADPIPVRHAAVGRLVFPSPLRRLRLQQPVRAAHVQLQDLAHSLKPKQVLNISKKPLQTRRENKTTHTQTLNRQQVLNALNKVRNNETRL
jgi:hypothetical protein